MKLWIYALILLYVLSPYDLIPDFFIGGGWIDDLIILGILGWYHFIYKKRPYRGQDRPFGYRGTAGNHEEFRESHDQERADGSGIEGRGAHEILGVTEGAPMEEIKAAYRRLVNQYHPDKVSHLGEEFRVLAERKFKEIQKAYQNLSDNKH
jgi:hypothetical protein